MAPTGIAGDGATTAERAEPRKRDLLPALLGDAGRVPVAVLVLFGGLTSLLEVSGIGVVVGMLLAGAAVAPSSVLLVVLLVVARATVQALASVSQQHLLNRFIDRLRLDLLDRVLHAPSQRFQRIGRGDLLGLLMSDVNRSAFALQQGVRTLQGGLALLTYGVGVVVVARATSIPLLLGLAATSAAALLQRSDAERLGRLQSRLNAALHRTVGDGLHGLKALRSASAEAWWLGCFRHDTDRFRHLLFQISRRQAVYNALRDGLAVTVVGVWLLHSRGDGLGREATLTTLALTYRAAGLLSAVVQSRRLFLGELSGYRELTRIRGLLGESLPAAEPQPEPCWPPPFQAFPLRVVVDSGRGPIRRFQLEPASLTAVVGPSGGGKSTLLDAFCGLLVGPASEWRFHGRPGETLRWGADGAEAWRRGLAYAPQETVLFEGTLRDNLFLGRDGCDDGEILRWFAVLGLEPLLERPGGLDAELQLTLDCFSGGEIRRLGLLRGWLLDRPIEVVDEPTASLDAVAAEQVRAILRERARERTVLVATHDTHLIASCDRLIDLSEAAGLDSGSGGRMA